MSELNKPITDYINPKSLFVKEHISMFNANIALYQNSYGQMVLSIIPLSNLTLNSKIIKAFLEMAREKDLKVIVPMDKNKEWIEQDFRLMTEEQALDILKGKR